MSNKMRWRYGPKITQVLKKSGTIAIEEGDMLKYVTSNRVGPVAASSDSTSLIGIAMEASPAADTSSAGITVCLIGYGDTFEFPTSKDTHAMGTCFQISADQILVKKTVVNLNLTATNVVCFSVRDNAASSSNVLVQFLPGRFQKTISST